MSTSTKNVITTTRTPHPVNLVYTKEFLPKNLPSLIHAMFAKRTSMPNKSGDTVMWSRGSDIDEQTVPLNEIGEPNALLWQRTDISAKVKPYGAKVSRSYWLDMTGLGSEQAEITTELGRSRDKTVDVLNRNTLIGAANQTTCSNSSDGTATHINETDINAVVQALLNSNCEPPMSPIASSTGVGSSPIEWGFPVLTSMQAYTAIRKVSTFIPIGQYPGGKGFKKEGEVGAIGHARFFLTTKGYNDGTYYYAVFLSKDAYGNVDFSGGKEPMKTWVEQGINPVTNIGWYLVHCCKILDESKLHVLRFTI
jgi:N4-gp56 family major capsid protein